MDRRPENNFVVWFDDSNMLPAGAKMPEISKEEEEELFAMLDKQFFPESVPVKRDVPLTGRLITA